MKGFGIPAFLAQLQQYQQQQMQSPPMQRPAFQLPQFNASGPYGQQAYQMSGLLGMQNMNIPRPIMGSDQIGGLLGGGLIGGLRVGGGGGPKRGQFRQF